MAASCSVFDRLLAVDLGFTPERVVLLSVEARDSLEPAQAREVGRQLLQRVQGMPGVESASISGWALFRGWSHRNNVAVPGRGPAQTFRLEVSPQFFHTTGTRLLDGREFHPRDSDAGNPIPVIVKTPSLDYLSGCVQSPRLTAPYAARPVEKSSASPERATARWRV